MLKEKVLEAPGIYLSEVKFRRLTPRFLFWVIALVNGN